MQGRAGKAGRVLLSLKRNCSRFIELQRLAIGDKVQRFNGDWRHKQTHTHTNTHTAKEIQNCTRPANFVQTAKIERHLSRRRAPPPAPPPAMLKRRPQQ